MEDDVNLFNVLQAIVEIPGGDNNIVPDNEIPVYNEGYFEYIVPRYSKWRRLKYIDMSLSEEIPNVILAACILHNFVLNRNG
ncbi:hypothetical protein NQ317_013459 [Molorchus minor]|uniref:DDE Tnp4 domain-containing protein n=1 Tax=Molorchus minor TaxID=1323400 RepID=A0ABQ9J5S2_9CUCU|nr:hypothetical protein NQ317_013459 [Molorchus minor]